MNRPQLVAPHPSVRAAMLTAARRTMMAGPVRSHPKPPGMDTGVIYPPEPLTRVMLTRASTVESRRRPAPARGVVHMIVLAVEFPDCRLETSAASLDRLLFSDDLHPTGSLRDYYTQASYGKLLLTGEIAGPIMLPEPLAYYAGGQSGCGQYPHNAQRMVEDALAAAGDAFAWSDYDSNADGYVDILTIVHAGPGAEMTGSGDLIWSHQWVLPQVIVKGQTRLYAYMTLPEDGKLGVWAHELGHLALGWPDMYDTDMSSEGLGECCIMAGGSWVGNGDTPALPSAWCRAKQGWLDLVRPLENTRVTLPPSHCYQRGLTLWTPGMPTSLYYLAEYRGVGGFDSRLPGGPGLYVYRVDETKLGNADEAGGYQVALVQADGRRDLERGVNGGDAGDPFPGAMHAEVFEADDLGLRLTGIREDGALLTAMAEAKT